MLRCASRISPAFRLSPPLRQKSRISNTSAFHLHFSFFLPSIHSSLCYFIIVFAIMLALAISPPLSLSLFSVVSIPSDPYLDLRISPNSCRAVLCFLEFEVWSLNFEVFEATDTTIYLT